VTEESSIPTLNIIETVGLTKEFGSFVANDGISLTVAQGEIKAVVGENGAGKTTLMNMLYGLLQPTKGQILVRGKAVAFGSPLDAINAGLGMVHQHFKLVPSLSICDNVVLGVEVMRQSRLGRLPIIDRKAQIHAVQQVADRYRFDLDVRARVDSLSVGERQRVEILKMLYRKADILILDEPTAVLTPQEVERLVKDLQDLKSEGKTIILITHKLGEVMEMSDSVTVIKRGRMVADLRTRDTSERELAQMMVGRDVVLTVQNDQRAPADSPVVYALEHVCTRDLAGHNQLADVSLQVHRGEVLGIAGVEGNGQSELLKVITGLMTTTSGHITFEGTDVTNWWPDAIRAAGIGLIHEDRYAQSLCREMSIADNVVAGYHRTPQAKTRWGLQRRKQINAKRDRLIEDYDIRVADPNGELSQLSGGNAQKIIVARELDAAPRLIIAGQPTRGVDVGSIEFIHHKLVDLKNSGVAVLLVSSELTEIMSLSDRIAVMYKNRIIGTVDARDTTTTDVGLLMAGVNPEVSKGGEAA